MSFPSFNPSEDVNLYFLQLDRFFRQTKVDTDNDKIDLLLLNLQSDVLSKVHYLLSSSTPTFAEIKTLFQKLFPPSDAALEQIIKSPAITKALDFVISLKKIAPTLDDEFVKSLLVTKLPQSTKEHVYHFSTEMNLVEFAMKVDSFMTIQKFDVSKTSTNNLQPTIRQTSASPRVPSTQPRRGLCWYHSQFGSRAQHCRRVDPFGDPCRFRPNSPALPSSGQQTSQPPPPRTIFTRSMADQQPPPTDSLN